MGGRGANGTDRLKGGSHAASTRKIEKVKNLKKQLTTAKAQLTRSERELASANGAVIAFDWHGNRPNEYSGDTSKPYSAELRERFEKAQDKAEAAYNKRRQAADKVDSIQREIDKLTARRRRANEPFF